jgi:hypothetical protein
VKRPGGKPTRLQTHELDQIAHAGGVAIVATHPEQVAQVLDQIERAASPTVGALGDAMALIVERLQSIEDGLRGWEDGGIADLGVDEVLAAVRSALGLAREGAAFGDGRTYAPEV